MILVIRLLWLCFEIIVKHSSNRFSTQEQLRPKHYGFVRLSYGLRRLLQKRCMGGFKKLPLQLAIVASSVVHGFTTFSLRFDSSARIILHCAFVFV